MVMNKTACPRWCSSRCILIRVFSRALFRLGFLCLQTAIISICGGVSLKSSQLESFCLDWLKILRPLALWWKGRILCFRLSYRRKASSNCCYNLFCFLRWPREWWGVQLIGGYNFSRGWIRAAFWFWLLRFSHTPKCAIRANHLLSCSNCLGSPAEVIISIFVPHPHFVSLFGSVRISQSFILLIRNEGHPPTAHPAVDSEYKIPDVFWSLAFGDVFDFVRLHHIKARMGEEAVAHCLFCYVWPWPHENVLDLSWRIDKSICLFNFNVFLSSFWVYFFLLVYPNSVFEIWDLIFARRKTFSVLWDLPVSNVIYFMRFEHVYFRLIEYPKCGRFELLPAGFE